MEVRASPGALSLGQFFNGKIDTTLFLTVHDDLSAFGSSIVLGWPDCHSGTRPGP